MSKTDPSHYISCTVCGDGAVLGRVVELMGSDAVVEDRLGLRATVAVDFIPEVKTGDTLLVHMGVAIARLEEPV